MTTTSRPSTGFVLLAGAAAILTLLATGVMALACLVAVPRFSADFTTCTGLAFSYSPALEARRLPSPRSIRFVPLGWFPEPQLADLAAHYRRKYGLRVKVDPRRPLPDDLFDPDRDQVVAERAVAWLRAAQPPGSAGREVVFGFLSHDLFIAGRSWLYAFSYREDDFAIMSQARMDYGCMGLVRASEEVIDARLRKMTTKNIGVLLYGLPLSDDPRSVLYRNVGGPQELDRMSEDF